MPINTKKALAESLKSLLCKTTLDNITVSDITNSCEVNRQTFYYHFQDIYALLDWIFVTEAEKVNAANKIYQNWQQGLTEVFEYLIQNKSFVTNAYRSIGREILEQYLYQYVYRVIFSAVEDYTRESGITDADKKFIADFYKYAFVGLMLDWVRTGMKEDYHGIVEKLGKLLFSETGKVIPILKVKK